jgi:hypothetical protein
MAPDKFYTYEEILKVDSFLRDVTSVGVMFYYGES